MTGKNEVQDVSVRVLKATTLIVNHGKWIKAKPGHQLPVPLHVAEKAAAEGKVEILSDRKASNGQATSNQGSGTPPEAA